jgi:hypothetical protein
MLTNRASTGECVICLETFSLMEKHQTQYICTLAPFTPFFELFTFWLDSFGFLGQHQ